MAQDVNIKYTDKDFNSLKSQLVDLAKNYFPDTYNDFSPTSPGMMFVEMAAYVGDILSYYQDTQLQETYLQYAQDPSNLYTLAYQMGYRPRTTSASSVEIELRQRVAASGSEYVPNFNQALTIGANSVVSNGVQKFLIEDQVDFSFSSSYDPTEALVYSIDNNLPAEYELIKKVKAKSGEVITQTETIGTASKFLTILIEDSDIIGIVDIVDSNNNIWKEVPFLGQETVYSETVNGGDNSNKVPYLVSTSKVSNRFVTRFNSLGQLQIQFGAGTATADVDTFLPNPTNVGSPVPIEGRNRSLQAYDPSNFLYTGAYGNAPANTTLTIRYLKGGGIESNVEANTLTTIESVNKTAADLTYSDTLLVNNPNPATGGKDGDTVEELRQNSLKAFNEQGRMVTAQDFAFRAMTMPSAYGSIAKTYVTQQESIIAADAHNDPDNPLGVTLYVLAYDNLKNTVKASTELKTNLRNYLAPYMMLTDGLTIKDAFTINLGIKFDIIALPNMNSREVLKGCTDVLKDHFNIDNWSINQPINISAIYTLLDRVKGVQTVQNIQLESLSGEGYSLYDYDVMGAMKNNILYPSLDPMIFEVKYPGTDIKGRITTL
jgi:hypothetical protein